MSNTVDNKVVEMRFDNQQFEKNADKTISTLDRLKQALKFDSSSTKSLDDLNRSTKSFNLDNLTKSVDSVSDRFSNMGIVGITVLQRLTNAAIDAGVKMAKSFAGGGIDNGFNKYSSKMEAVQVMAINTGKSIEQINPVLARLQHYTDETSYKYEQMIRAMGQFTANGVDLTVAEDMVEGIANWAATAGVNVEAAGRAFTNMAQAVANGSLVWKDAQTLNEMNMFTPEFRNKVIEVAESMGALRREGDSLYATYYTLSGKQRDVEVTAENLTTTLSKAKWLTTPVLAEVLHQYADTTEDFGAKAYDAAYQAKTFSDALGAVKESISTGWANSFEIIFGNYEEAARLWTAGCELVIEFTAAISDERNAILEEWRALKGRNELVNAMVNILRNLARVITPIKAAFSEAFPAITGERIVELTKSFNEFLISIRPSYKTVSNIAIAFKGLFDVVSFGIDIVKTFVSTIFSFLSPGKDLLDTISGIAAFLGSLLSAMTEVARESGVIELIVGSIIGVLSTLLGILVQVGTAIYNFLKKVKELPAVKNAIDGISAAFEKVKKAVPGILDRIVTGFNNLIDKANKLKDSGMTPFFENLNSSIATFWGWITKAKDKLVEFVDFVLQKFGVVDASKDTINGLTTSFSELLNKLGNKELPDALERTGEAAEETGKKFTWLKLAMAAGGAAVISNVLGIGNAFGKANKNVGASNSLFSNLFTGFGGFAKKAALFGGIGTAIALLYKNLKGSKKASDSAEEASDGLIVLEESIDPLVDITRSGEGQETLSFFGKLGQQLGEFGSKVTTLFAPATDAVKGFFKELNVGKVIVLAFVGSIVGIIAQFAITLGGLPLLMMSLTSTFFSLGSAIRQWSIWGVDTFGDTCMKIGQAVVYFAGALFLISRVPTDKFKDVMNLATGFLGVMATIAISSSIVALFGKKGLENIWEFGLTLMSLGGAAILVATAMTLIARLNPKQIIGGIVAIVGSIALLAAVMKRFGGLSIILNKGQFTIKGMVGTIVALAAAIVLIGKLLTPEQLAASTHALFTVTGILSLFALALNKVGTDVGKASLGLGVGILAFTGSIILLMKAFEMLPELCKAFEGSSALDQLNQAITMGGIFGILTLFMLGAKRLGEVSMGVGVAALGIGGAILAMSYAFKLIGTVAKDMTGGQIIAGLGGIAVICAGLGAAFIGLGRLNKSALKASLALIPITVAVTALTALGLIISVVPWPYLGKAALGIVVLVGAVAAICRAMAFAKGVKTGPFVAVLGSLIAIVGSLILLSNFTEIPNLMASMTALFVVFGMFSLVVATVSTLTKKIQLKALWSIVGAITVISLALGLLSKFGGDATKMVAGAASIGIVLGALAGSLKLIGSIKLISKSTLTAINDMIKMVLVIGLALTGMTAFGQSAGSIVVAAIGLGIAMAAFSGCLWILSKIPMINPALLSFIGPMIGAVVAIGLALWGIATFGKDAGTIFSAMVALSLTLVAFSGAIAILNAVPVVNAAIIPIIFSMIAAVAAIGIALVELAKYDWETLKGAVMGFGATMLILIGAVALLGALGSIGIGEIGAGILIAIAVAMGIFAAASIGFAFAATLVANAIMTITQALTILGTIGPEAAENIRNVFVQIGAGLGEGLATMIVTFTTTITSGLITAIGTIVTAIKLKAIEFFTAGADLINAIGEGIDSVKDSILEKIPQPIKDAASWISTTARGLFEQSGRDVGLGVSDGINDSLGVIRSSGETAGQQLVEGYRDGAEWHSIPHWLADFFKDWGIGIDANASWIEVKNAVVGAMAGGALGKNFQASSIPFINQVMSLLAQAEGSINIFGQRVKANATNAVKNAKNTIESAKEAFSGKKLTKEDWDAMHPQPLDITPPGGSGGGGGGGGGSAKEEAKELFDVMTDGKDIIEKHIELFGKLHTKLGYTQPMDLAKSAVQKLAESIYASSVKMVDAETQAAKTTEDKLAEMKEAFDAFVSDVANSVSGQVDVWGSLTYAQATATKDWDKNFKNQQKLVNEWKRSLIMIARRVSPEFLQEIAKMGPEMTLQVLEWASLTDEGLKRVEDRYLGHEEYVKNTLEEVLAIAAQSAEGMTKATDSWVSSLGVAIEYSGDAAKAAGEVAKGVVDANKKMGESATEYAKVTDQMAAKAVKAYYDIKQQVEDTINNSIDLFTKFEEKDEDDIMSVDDMTEAAQSQLHAWTKWGDLMAKLQAKNPAEGLLNKFMNGGVDMLGELENVVNASESEFQTLNACFEQLETFASDIGGKVGMAGANAAIMFSDGFLNNINTEGSKQAVTTMVQNVVDALIGQIEDENAGVIPIGTTVDEKISEGIKDSADSVGTALTETVSGASDAGDDVAKDRSYTMGGYFPAGVAQGIADGTWQVSGAVVTMVEEAYQAGMDASMSASPSKLFAKLGGYFGQGLAQGMDGEAAAIDESSRTLAERAYDATKAVVDHIQSILNGEVNVDPTIRPVLDTSEIEAGMSSVDSMFNGRSYSLSRGMEIQNSSDSIRDLIAQTMASMNANTPQPAYAGPPINMYVYGAEGQDEEEIANIVESRLMHRINMRGGTWR